MRWFRTDFPAISILVWALASCSGEGSVGTPSNAPLAPVSLEKMEAPVIVEPPTLSPDQVFKAVSPSVVEVTNPTAQTMGSGVEIKPGLFVTNCHVLKGGQSYFIQSHGQTAAAQLKNANAAHDICLLSANLVEVHPVEVRSSSTLTVGEAVYAIGNPEGLDLTLSEGIVSQLRRPDPSERYPYIQTTAAISHGSSGGGIFDKRGKLIGITSFMFSEGQNLNFAAPIDWALELAQNTSFNAISAAMPNARAIAAMNSKDLSDAVFLLENASLSAAPTSELMASLGYAYLRQGRYQEAKDELVRSLNASAADASTWLNLGQALAELGQKDDAVRAVLRGISLASHKEAVVQGLREASTSEQESDNWRDVAQEALIGSQQHDEIDPRSIDESTSVRLH